MNNRHRVVGSDRRWRAATVPGLAVALLAPGLGAATIRGRLTQCCGEPAQDIVLKAYEHLSVGTPGPRGCICGLAESIVDLGPVTTLADGSFSLSYVPSEPLPEDCSFEASVYVEIETPDRPWGVLRSPTQPRGEVTVFENIDLGFGDACPELGFSFSLEGPSLVTGLPGESVRFDVFVVLGAQCLGDQVINIESWHTIVTAEGGSVVRATTSGTAAAGTDAEPPGLASPCRQEATAVEPLSPPFQYATEACPSQPVAHSSMTLLRCPAPSSGHEPLPFGQGTSHRLLRVTLEATIPPPGLERSCTVYFRDRCPLLVAGQPARNYCREGRWRAKPGFGSPRPVAG